MKNALILHATANNSKGNWYFWLKTQLEKLGYEVWLPDLPNSDTPNTQKYNEFILANKNFEFSNETIIVGHSSGAVSALSLLEELPNGTLIDKCILVSVFENDLGWGNLKELFIKPLDFEKIKTKAKKFIVVHSDTDPYCPLDGAKSIAEKLNAEFIVKKGQGHFNLEASSKYHEFPFLLELI